MYNSDTSTDPKGSGYTGVDLAKIVAECKLAGWMGFAQPFVQVYPDKINVNLDVDI
jgi:hypothetical protein